MQKGDEMGKSEDEEMTPETKNWLVGMADWAVKGLIVGMFGMLYQLNTSLKDINYRLATVEAEIVIIKSQMVGWDVLKRMEGQLYGYASMGKGNEAMGVVAGILKIERESRENKK